MDLNQYLDKIYQEAKFAKEEVAKNYDRWLNHYRGQFWPSKRPDWRVSAVINHLAELIQREVAYLTDSRPVIRVVARNDHLQPVAEVLENIIAALWEERNWQQKQQELLILAAIFGAAFARCVWNPQLDDGRGDIDIVVGDPRVYLVDPFCLRANQLDEAEYIIHEYVVPKSVLDEQYPHLASKIKPTYGAEEEEKGFKHFLRKLLFGTEKEQKAILPRCLVQEFWIKDRTRVELEDGRSVRKYPGGRHIVRVGHLILKDEPNPYIDERFPIDMFDWSFNPNSAWGISEVEYLHSLQEMYNKLMAIIVENAILTCNAIWIGEEDALSPAAWSRLTNKPGAIVRVRPGKTLRREPPQPLPAYIQNAVQYLERQMQILSGMTDVMHGERGALTSGVAIECVDAETECLTKRGWKKYWEIEPDDEIYVFNPETNCGEWSPILKLNVQEEYDGPMYVLQNKNIDALVTPNHRWLVGSTNGHFREGQWKFLNTPELNTDDFIPSIAPVDHIETSLYSDAFVELIGWIVTEGCYHNKVVGGKEYPEVKIFQSVANEKACKRIEKCIRDLSLQHNVRYDRRPDRTAPVKIWTITGEQAKEIIEKFPDKRPGYEFLCSLPQHQLHLLAEAMLLGDGRWFGFNPPRPQVSIEYFSADKELADQFQMAITLAGYSSSISIMPPSPSGFFKGNHKSDRYGDCWRITCKRTGKIGIRNLRDNGMFEQVHYKGPIWCPTTTTGTWVARRNGKVYITGNSLQVAAQAIIRLRARSFEQFLARIGQKLISRIFQFYTTDRVIKILGPDGNIREYEWVRKQIMDPILKYYEGDYRQKLHSAFRDLQFKVVEGSSLAMNKIQKVMMAITFYRMGVIDEEALLEIAEWPHRKEILERKAQMMQQQQGRPTKVVKVPEPSRRMEAEMRAKGMSGEVLKP